MTTSIANAGDGMSTVSALLVDLLNFAANSAAVVQSQMEPTDRDALLVEAARLVAAVDALGDAEGDSLTTAFFRTDLSVYFGERGAGGAR